jgi:hypothetical protein
VSRPALGPTQPPVQSVPGVLSPGVKRGQGLMLTTHPYLVPRSWMSRSYTSSPPKRLHGVTYFYSSHIGRYMFQTLKRQTSRGTQYTCTHEGWMKINDSTLKTGNMWQQGQATSRDTFSSLVLSHSARCWTLVGCCKRTARRRDLSNMPSLSFWLLKESPQSKFTDVCKLFTVMIVLT